MNSKKEKVNKVGVERNGKLNWIEKLRLGTKSSKQKETIHCNDYSSVICLRCDKCWAGSRRTTEATEEK